MKKFAVAYFSNFDEELKLKIIKAESDLKAGAILVAGEDEKESGNFGRRAHRNRPDRCHWNAVWSETVR